MDKNIGKICRVSFRAGRILILVAAGWMGISTARAAEIVVSTLKPSDNFLLTNTDGTSPIFTDALESTSTTPKYAIGQSFTTSSALNLDKISIQYRKPPSTPVMDTDATAKLIVFTYDSATFISETWGDYDNPTTGTSLNVLYTEVFGANFADVDQQWLTFDLTANQSLAAGTQYGFLVWFSNPSGGATTGGRFDNYYGAATYAGGGYIRVIKDSVNQTAGNDLNFVLQESAVVDDIILVDDKFLDGSLANGTEAGEIDTAWWGKKASSGATTWSIVTDNNAPLSGNAIANSGSAPNTMLYGGFATTTLAVGQTIKFELDMRRFAVDTTTAYTQLLMGYDGGTPMTADIVGTVAPITDDKMIATTAMNDRDYGVDTNPVHWVYQLTRRSDGDYDRLVTVGSYTPFSDTVLASSNPTYQFNQVAFAMPIGTSTRAIVDNIKVSLPAPAATKKVTLFMLY